MKQSILIFFFSLVSSVSFSQGCSDAGFCTIGDLSLQHSDTFLKNEKRQQLRFLNSIGIGDEKVLVITPALEYQLQMLKWTLQGKLTANYASGNLSSVAGAGDFYLSGTFKQPVNARSNYSMTLGVKLPLNQGNLKSEGRSLPMQYQSSLGTIDLIAGISFQSGKWQWAAGWQQPLTGRNRNQFLPAYWDRPAANKYLPSNDFKRSGDVLLRTSYNLILNKWKLTPGLLAIYHLNEDAYIDANVSPGPVSLKGSKGTTLNLTALLEYPVSKKIQLACTAGVPLLVREIRPDGLTRSFVVTPEIRIMF